MSKVNMTVGGAAGYGVNLTLPYVSGNAGAAYSAVATLAATPYPEPAEGNVFILKNTGDSNKFSLAVYDGTAWQCIGKNA